MDRNSELQIPNSGEWRSLISTHYLSLRGFNLNLIRRMNNDALRDLKSRSTIIGFVILTK